MTIILEQAKKVDDDGSIQHWNILCWYFMVFVAVLCSLMPEVIEAFVIAIAMQLHSLL